MLKKYKEWLFWRTIEDIPLVTLAKYCENRGNKVRFEKVYKDLTNKMLAVYKEAYKD